MQGGGKVAEGITYCRTGLEDNAKRLCEGDYKLQ